MPGALLPGSRSRPVLLGTVINVAQSVVTRIRRHDPVLALEVITGPSKEGVVRSRVK